MNRILFLLLLLSSFDGITQLMRSNSVELGIKNNIKVSLHDAPNGTIIDSIEALETNIETCIVDIDSSHNGWVKIKKYYYVPWMKKRKSSDKTYWLKVDFLESALQPNFSLRKEADATSEITFEINHNFDVHIKVGITDINGKWIKVKFKINDILLEGWVANTDLCPLKHTTCNYPW